MSSDRLMEIYNLLSNQYGPQHWWPGDTKIEIAVGAILTQNTNWGNVEKAINNLKAADVLDADRLYAMDISRLAELIRPAGYYNVKAKRLKNFIGWLVDEYAGDIDSLDAVDAYSLREQLLGIKGVGRETADSILLYALGKKVFVVDAYTCRVLGRHNLIDRESDYEQIREFFEYNLADDIELFNEFHALFVKVGKEHCKPKPKCQGCPLEGLEHSFDDEQY